MQIQNLEQDAFVFEEFGKAKKCGCYIRHPHLFKEANVKPRTNILMPLKHIDYEIELSNGLASVTLQQKYFNPTNKFLQMDFSFPIDPNSCIYKFVAQFGTKRIEGIVKQKEEAKKQYNEAIKQGKQAVYAQIDAKSNDIMNLQIGNVGPHEELKITVSYLSELTVDQNTFYQFHLSSTISPRYMNYVPPTENKIAQKVQLNKQSVKGSYTWNFKVIVNTTRKVIFNKSSTHNLTLLNQNQSGTETTLVMGQQCVPNKDFSFVFTTQDFHLPSYVLGRTDVSSTVMLSFIPKFCQLTVDDAYKASTLHAPLQIDMNAVKGEYIFLLDRSGSMGGSRIKKAVEALCLFLKSLPEDTYFNVISFGDYSQNLNKSSVKYNKQNLQAAIKKVQKMTADLGGTQIYNPLLNIFKSQHVQGYPRQIFLLTDGGVSNTEGVIKLVEQSTKFSRVHCIGIGNGASESLIKGCAEKGKGKFIFISDDENPSDKIIGLLEESLTPVISKINLEYDKNIVSSIIPNPTSIPYILKNQVVNFYITFKGQLEKDTQFKFSYEDSMNKKLYSSNIKVSSQSTSYPFVDKMAHSRVIKTLENASKKNNVNIEDEMFYVKVVDKKAQTIKESVKHQILSEFTAFICVQKQLVDGKYQQIKDTGKQKIKIQNVRPEQYLLQRGQMLQDLCLKSNYISSQSNAFMCRSLGAPKMEMAVKKSKASTGIFNNLFGGIADGVSNLFSSKKKQQLPTSCLKQQNILSFDCAKQSAPVQYNLRCSQDQCEQDYEDKMDLQQFNECDIPMECCIQSQNDCLLMDLEQKQIQQEEVVQKKRKKSGDRDRKDKEKEYKKQEKQVKKQEKANIKLININDVIKQQNIDGSWNNLKLLQSLFKSNWNQILEEIKNMDSTVCCSYLIAKWIQKNHPQKQYALLVKKAFSWIKKVAKLEELTHLDKYLV